MRLAPLFLAVALALSAGQHAARAQETPLGHPGSTPDLTDVMATIGQASNYERQAIDYAAGVGAAVKTSVQSAVTAAQGTAQSAVAATQPAFDAANGKLGKGLSALPVQLNTYNVQLPTTIPKPDTTISGPDVKYESPDFDFSGFPEHSITTPEVPGVDISPITDALSHGKGSIDKSIPEINVRPPAINFATPEYTFKVPKIGHAIGKAINTIVANIPDEPRTSFAIPGFKISLPNARLPSISMSGKGKGAAPASSPAPAEAKTFNPVSRFTDVLQSDKSFYFPISWSGAPTQPHPVYANYGTRQPLPIDYSYGYGQPAGYPAGPAYPAGGAYPPPGAYAPGQIPPPVAAAGPGPAAVMVQTGAPAGAVAAMAGRR